jgi:ABC-type bacteriocin/lantibiotic exporter with double-glycine peptidase domain
MDDILSALDSRVSKQILKETVLGHLRFKTRILITHNLNYLKYADRVLVLDKGTVAHLGSYEDYF